MKKFRGMHFSKCYIDDIYELANYLLYYDEIHFVLPGQHNIYDWISEENLNRDAYVKIIGDNPWHDEELDKKNALEILKTIQFVKNNHHLIDKTLFFHKEALCNVTDQYAKEIVKRGLTETELFEMINSLNSIEEFPKKLQELVETVIPGRFNNILNNRDLKAYFDYINKFSDGYSLNMYTKGSALLYTEKNDIQLILETDNEINHFWGQKSVAKDLASVMAYQSLKLVVPSISVKSIDEVLELREKLSDQLIPFRMNMRKLATDLRCLSKESNDIDVIHKEAQFIVETQVEPALNELKRRIKKEDSTFYKKLFGNVINWIPFLAHIYFAPTPEKFFELVKRVGNDSQSLYNELNNDPSLSQPGFGFLLGIEEFGQN